MNQNITFIINATQSKLTPNSTLHWSAGSNQISILTFILSNNIFQNADIEVESKLAKGRTALHYACRNGHLDIVKILIETYNANPHAKAKQGVTPFQLAVWQNRLDVCQYLVKECGVIPNEDVNDFGCGAIHWLGIIPFHRANITEEINGDEMENGRLLMPLAKWLTSQPNINIHATQNQGHTVLHKASWGGHLDLVKYLHEEYEMYDNNTDIAGNYAADLYDMMNTERHKRVALYLRKECSMERLESFKMLGLEDNASRDEIRKAYLEKAKLFHPDKRCGEDCDDNFNQLRKAYEHLTLEGGISTKQKNPAHSINLLLEIQDSPTTTTITTTIQKDDLFKARILAVLLEYGDKGLNLANIPKKWDQIWPLHPIDSFFPHKRKAGDLLRMIKD